MNLARRPTSFFNSILFLFLSLLPVLLRNCICFSSIVLTSPAAPNLLPRPLASEAHRQLCSRYLIPIFIRLVRLYLESYHLGFLPTMATPPVRQWGVTPPISTVLPTKDELSANDDLIAELKAQNNFELPTETERRCVRISTNQAPEPRN